jgi:hypothetical protein
MLGSIKPKATGTRKENRGRGTILVRQKNPPAKERVLVEFPLPLLKKAEAAAAQLALDRSKFIRAAVEEKISNMEKTQFDQELAAAYTANAEFDVKICDEFKYVDGEQSR